MRSSCMPRQSRTASVPSWTVRAPQLVVLRRALLSSPVPPCVAAVEGSGVRAVDYLTALEYLSTLCAITTPRDPKHRSGKVVLLPTETLDSVQAIMRMNQRG